MAVLKFGAVDFSNRAWIADERFRSPDDMVNWFVLSNDEVTQLVLQILSLLSRPGGSSSVSVGILHLLSGGGYLVLVCRRRSTLTSKPPAIRNLVKRKKAVCNGRRHDGEFGQFGQIGQFWQANQPNLNWLLLIFRALILFSRVLAGILSLAAAPDGPETRPWLSASAASMISRSLRRSSLKRCGA